MNFLVDTNVLSAGSPTSRGQQGALQAWMDGNSARLFMPSVVVAEIVGGIVAARLAGAVRKAAALDAWFEDTLRLYGTRVLPLDVATARTTGAVLARARAAGHNPGFADLAIAGIAVAHGLTVLTRNLRHFAPLGVPACDPYATLPD